MQDIISQINTLFQQNQVLSTVAGGSVIVWVVSNIKMLWSKFWSAVTAIVSFTVVNTYEDTRGNGRYLYAAQDVFNTLISSTKPLWERTRNLDLSYFDLEEKRQQENAATDVTYGFSIRWMFGKIVFCHRSIEKQQKITVTTVLRVFFASKEKFLDKIKTAVLEEIQRRSADQQTRDHVSVYNGVCTRGQKYKRSMDSIFTNNNEHYQLLDAIKEFLDNKDKYRKLSYPYSFSALLYGHPGCGKSSTILAVASALNKDIQYVNLAKLSFERFLSTVNNPDHDIIVFEDIDAINASCTRKRSSDDDNDANDADLVECPIDPGDAAKIEEYKQRRNGGFLINDDGEIAAEPVAEDMPSSALAESITSAFGTSLSDLLNVTDGLLSSDGSICIFTTNHIDRLDPALLRAGRMNKCIEFTLLNAETAGRMIEANLGYTVDNLKDAINPAELQEMILHITLGSATKDDLVRKFCKAQGGKK